MRPASPVPIIPIDVSKGDFIVQKSGYLASEPSVELSIAFQKKLGAGFFGGEGFIMQKLHGTGMAFVEIDGYVVEYELQAGQQMLIDTGYLAAMSGSCTIDIQTVKGIGNVLFGGEGLVQYCCYWSWQDRPPDNAYQQCCGRDRFCYAQEQLIFPAYWGGAVMHRLFCTVS